MNPNNRSKLADRVTRAAEASLAAEGTVSCLEILTGIGWLDPGAVKRWQQGQIDCLEAVVQSNLARISEAATRRLNGCTAPVLYPPPCPRRSANA